MKQRSSIFWLLVAGMFLDACQSKPESMDKQSGAQIQSVTSSETEIRQFFKEWQEASIKGDRNWYERHYAESFVKTDQAARVLNKKDQVSEVEPIDADSLQVDELNIQTFGEFAFATFKVTIRGKTTHGDYNVNSRATAVFIKKDGNWKITALHATDIPPDEQ